MKKVLQFLEKLSENNNKEWFHENRDWYEESRDKVLFVTEVMINEIRKFDTEIPAMDPKECMFRIFRDVRFSSDKRPYKTNFGSFIARGGRKSMRAGYYFHVEPGASFAGGGMYMPPAEPLKTLRMYIAEHADEFLEIINDKDFKKIYPEMYDHKLKTAPKGFDKSFEHIGLLRYQSFVFSTPLADDVWLGENFIGQMVESFKQLYRVNHFLNKAL
jgi:uncharacterized protein (TIGR02453 family)